MDDRVIDDRLVIEKRDVETLIRNVAVSYSWLRRQYLDREAVVDAAFDEGDVTAGIDVMVSIFNLPVGYVRRIGYAASISAYAELHTKSDLYWNFSDQFKITRQATIYFRLSKAELLRSRYLLKHTIAHELAHVRMRLDRHELRCSEFATDIIAILTTGTTAEYNQCVAGKYGYVRVDLLDEVMRCLKLYADRIYVK